MKLKIGFLTERMILGFGVDLVVHQTARRLVDKGHAVTVFTTWTGAIYQETPYSVVNLKETVNGPNDVCSPHFMVMGINYLARQDIDVWVIHTPPFYQWLEYLHSPVVMVEHGTPPGKYFPKKRGRGLDAKTRYRFDVIYQSLRPGDGLVAVSEYIRSQLPGKVRERTTVILNGGDHYPRATADEIEAFRKSVGVAHDQVMILWVGRITPGDDWQPYKGLREFVDIAPKLSRRCENIRIVAVGRAEDNARRLLEDAGIVPVFNLPMERMPAAFGAADIFLNTSKWEGFNLPLIEAQFQGTPVVAYHIGAHPEVVASGDSGILVEGKQQLLAAIEKLVKDPDRRADLAAGARKHASSFTWDDNAQQLERLIEGCCQQALRHGRSVTADVHAGKLPPYSIWKSRELIENLGWMGFFKEVIRWAQLRLNPEK